MKKLASFLALSILALLATASAVEIAKVEIKNNTYYESLTVLGDNWIELGGGKEVKIPEVVFEYSGVDKVSYVKGDKTINVTSLVGNNYAKTYPYETHRYYQRGDSVIVNFNTTLSGTIYVYTVKTGPMELKNALEKAIDGDTSKLRNLLNNAVNNTTLQLPQQKSFKLQNLEAGDYVVIALKNSSSELNVTFVAATAFEVLEHNSTLEATTYLTRSSIGEGFVSGTFKIVDGSSDAQYTYIAALIKKDQSVDLKLESGGKKANTNLTANDAVLVSSFKVGGVGLSKVNATTVYNWINDAFSIVSVEKAKANNVYEFSLPVSGFPDGEYYLYIAAWNSSNPSQRVVAFNWSEVKILTVIETYNVTEVVTANTEVRITVPQEKVDALGVLELNITVPQTMKLEVHISRLSSLPPGVPQPTGKNVYGFLDISFVNADTKQEVEPTGYVKFKVPKSWITGSGVYPSSILLIRYHDNVWRELETKLVGEDTNSYYYLAKIGPFSIFAIAAKPTTTFEVSPTSISVEVTRGSSKIVTLSISNTGSYELRGVALSASGAIASWISFTPAFISSIQAGKSESVTVTISVPTGASTGTHSGKIIVNTENGGSKEVAVSVVVRGVVAGVGAGVGYVVPTPPAPAEAIYHEVFTIPANIEKRIELPSDKADVTGVVAIGVKVSEKMTLIVQVSKLKSLPPEVPPPLANVYSYLDIVFFDYAKGSEIEPTGYIEFKVEKSWIAENKYKPNDVVLMRYSEKWITLKTEMIGEDNVYCYYRAETGGFSIYAIAVPTPVVTPTPTTPPVTPTPTPTVTPTPAEVPTALYIVAFVAVIVVLIALALALRRKR